MPRLLTGPTILVLDDNERAQAIWHGVLSAIGVAHVGAADLRTAQDLLAMHDIDLVVIDEHPADPQSPGSDLALWIRESNDAAITGMPVIACTSDQTPAVRARLLAASVSNVLAKPIDAQAVLLSLEELLHHPRLATSSPVTPR